MNRQGLTQGVDFLSSWLDYRCQRTNICGLSVSVLVGQKMIFSRTYGLANAEDRTPLNKEHLFNVASQTKMLTGVAILRLVQDGKLALDDRAAKYLSWLRAHQDRRVLDITIRHLLSHSAGLLRDGLDSDFWLFKRPYPSTTELHKTILGQDLVFAPGKSVKYSNLAFALLGEVVEKLSGLPFETLTKRDILLPLSMRLTTPDYPADPGRRVAVGYGLETEGVRSAIGPRRPAKAMAATIGTYATTEEMCRLAAALFKGEARLINNDLKNEMQRAQVAVTSGYDRGIEFGLGLEIHTVGKRRLVGHSGHVGGHLTATFFDPLAKIAVSVAANAKDTPSINIARGIFGALNHFLHRGLASAKRHTPRFGVRLYNEISTVEVIDTGRSLVAIDPDDWEPFAFSEALEKVDDTTLRLITPHSVTNQGELLQYEFKDGVVQSVRFAGLTMRPIKPI